MIIYLVLLTSDTYAPFVESAWQCEADAIAHKKHLFSILHDDGLCIGIQKLKVNKTKVKVIK